MTKKADVEAIDVVTADGGKALDVGEGGTVHNSKDEEEKETAAETGNKEKEEEENKEDVQVDAEKMNGEEAVDKDEADIGQAQKDVNEEGNEVEENGEEETMKIPKGRATRKKSAKRGIKKETSPRKTEKEGDKTDQGKPQANPPKENKTRGRKKKLVPQLEEHEKEQTEGKVEDLVDNDVHGDEEEEADTKDSKKTPTRRSTRGRGVKDTESPPTRKPATRKRKLYVYPLSR